MVERHTLCLPGNSGIHPVLLFQKIDGDWESGGRGRRAESRGESVGHVCDEPERPLPGADGEDDGEHDEAVEKEPDQHGHEVETELTGNQTEIFHFQNLVGRKNRLLGGRGSGHLSSCCWSIYAPLGS